MTLAIYRKDRAARQLGRSAAGNRICRSSVPFQPWKSTVAELVYPLQINHMRGQNQHLRFEIPGRLRAPMPQLSYGHTLRVGGVVEQSQDAAVVEALVEAGERAGQFGIDGRDLLDQA